MGVNRAVVDHLAGAINHRHFHTGTQAGVQAQGRARAGRSQQQQVFQIGGKHVDGFSFSGFAYLGHQVGFNLGRELHPPGPAHHLAQPFVGGTAVVADAPVGSNALLRRMGLAAVVFGITHHKAVGQDAFIAATQNGQGPVRRNLLQRLDVVEVIAEFRTFVFLAFHHADLQLAFLPHEIPQRAQQLGIFGKALHQDVAGAIKRGLGVVNAGFGIQVAGSGGFRVQCGVIKQGVRQRFQPRLLGNLGLGAALWLVGQVQVFQAVLGVCRLDGRAQLVGQLALLLDAVEDSAPAVFQLPQVTQSLFQGAQLAVVQGAGDFFPVTGNKRNGGTFIQQGDGGVYLLLTYAEFISNAPGDTVHATSVILLTKLMGKGTAAWCCRQAGCGVVV